jgi:RES domain-containing protein
VVYASEHAALSLLEVLVHVSPRDLPAFRLMAGNIPDGLVKTVAPGDLPDGWDAYPYTPASQRAGDAWLTAGDRVALKVPSALVPGYNVLLNPRHEAFAHLETEAEAHTIPYARRTPP